MHLFDNICCTICLLCIIVGSDISLALRDVRVEIPHAVRKGEKTILKCLYDLEDDILYSVKWYKGRREFYSFTPKENPAMKVFQFAGVKVDRSSSNESQLVLETVNAATSGKYSCEVSADAPSFHTLIGAGELEVVVPGKDPVITGIRSRYKVGDIARGNCTSSHSRPAANITWTVNGYETNPAHIRHFKPHKDPRELETVISAIHFVVTPQHFIYGKLKIRCTAFIHDVYWKSTEKSIEENRLNKAGTSNVVHKFSEDYFDLDEDNIVDRSDTYMTHIKGDVSSLNANGCSALYKCSCFWPRLIILSLVMYATKQMLQLLQQLLSQETTTTNATAKTKQNSGNCETSTTNTEANKAKDTNLFKIKEKLNDNKAQLNSKIYLTAALSRICYENKSTIERWPKGNHFHIKLIKEEHPHQHQHQQKYSDCKQLHMRSQLQLECYKIHYEYECNLKLTTTQMANILPSNIILKSLRYFWNKVCNKHYKLYAQFYTAPPNIYYNSLNIAICLNTRTTGNSTLPDFYLTATKQIIKRTQTT